MVESQCTAMHACKVETVTLAEAIKEVILIQDLLELALRTPINAILKDDNAAVFISANKKYSLAMRGLQRTQCISIGYIRDVISAKPEPGHGTIGSEKVPTLTHRGDMFTKALDPGKHASALKMMGVILLTDRPSSTTTPGALRADSGSVDKDQTEKKKREKIEWKDTWP